MGKKAKKKKDAATGAKPELTFAALLASGAGEDGLETGMVMEDGVGRIANTISTPKPPRTVHFLRSMVRGGEALGGMPCRFRRDPDHPNQALEVYV